MAKNVVFLGQGRDQSVSNLLEYPNFNKHINLKKLAFFGLVVFKNDFVTR